MYENIYISELDISTDSLAVPHKSLCGWRDTVTLQEAPAHDCNDGCKVRQEHLTFNFNEDFKFSVLELTYNLYISVFMTFWDFTTHFCLPLNLFLLLPVAKVHFFGLLHKELLSKISQHSM